MDFRSVFLIDSTGGSILDIPTIPYKLRRSSLHIPPSMQFPKPPRLITGKALNRTTGGSVAL